MLNLSPHANQLYMGGAGGRWWVSFFHGRTLRQVNDQLDGGGLDVVVADFAGDAGDLGLVERPPASSA